MAQQVSKNIQALAEAAEEKRRQQEQGFAPSAPSVNYGGGWEADMGRMTPKDREAYMASFLPSRSQLASGGTGLPFADKFAPNQVRPFPSQNEQAMMGAPEALAGLGLGGGFVASQVGGQASTSSRLSPFAQQVAAADTARLNPPKNPPKGNPIFGRNVPTNSLNPSVKPMPRQPSLETARESARQSARLAASRRGPSAMAKISQFVDNALSGASKFARSVNIPSLLLTPNTMGDATLTGNNIILSPFEQMATDNYRASMAAGKSAQQYQAMIEQGGLMDPPSAAEAGDNLINIGNSLFPNEAPVGLMTPELRDQRAAERQRKYGDIELQNPADAIPLFGQDTSAIRRSVQDVLNTPKEIASRFDEFAGTLMRAATPKEELGYTPPSVGDVLATAGIRDAEGNIIGSGGRSEAITGPTRRPPATITATPETTATITATPETTATANTTTTDGMDITQRAMTEAINRTAETNAQRADLSPAQQNFLTRKDKGTPLEPNEIIAAQRYAVSQGQIFDPETGYSQAEFYGQRYKGQSIGDYLRGADTPQGATEQFVDPQGRLRRRMAGTDQLAPEYSSYERESAAREARLAARPDFMEAQPSQARKDGVMSMAQAVKVAGGDRKKARSMIELQKMGRDPLTGQPEKPDGMTEYQAETLRQNQERIDLSRNQDKETLRQNQERIDFAKDQAEAARKAAEAAGATQAEKDAYDIAQRKVNLATTYQKLLEDQETPVFDARDIDADLDSISDQLDIIYDPESGVFRRGKIWGEGEVIKLDDPKNASIVRTIGTYKVGKALLDKYPKKG
jgi:hypothetical protein